MWRAAGTSAMVVGSPQEWEWECEWEWEWRREEEECSKHYKFAYRH